MVENFHAEADALALEIEQTIQETRNFLAALPEVEPRQKKSVNTVPFRHNQ